MFTEHFVNINGDIVLGDKAQISIFDRGFLFGDSIYEVTYSENGAVLFLDEHLDRLYQSAMYIDLELTLTRDQLKKELLRTLKASTYPRAYIRLIITRGTNEINLDPTLSQENNFIIIVKPLPEYPEALYKKGLFLTISSIERNSIKSTNPRAKSGNYLNNVMALNEAKKKNADDAIMVNSNGNVTEGTTFNIWFVKDSILHTPSLNSGLLKGITRDKVINICEVNNLTLRVDTFSPSDFLDADEMFISSSTKGIMPVYKLDDKVFGSDIKDWPMIDQLIKLYSNYKTKYQQNTKYKYL